MGVEVPPEAISANPATSEEFTVMPGNHASLRAFLALETQWRVAATMAGLIWLGLEYQALDIVMRRLGSPEGVFFDLQLMEQVALDVFSEAQP